MMLRVACDLDGTLANMDAALQRLADRLFGAGFRHAALPDEQRAALWAAVEAIPDFWMTLDEVEPGAVSRLATAASANRWEVIFLTRRCPTAGDMAQRQSQRWLQAHGFELPAVYVMPGSRGKLAEALDLHAVLDDEPGNCVDVATHSKARAILLWRGAPDDAPDDMERLDIETVFSFDDAVKGLERLASRVAKRGGLLGRLRDAIGV